MSTAPPIRRRAALGLAAAAGLAATAPLARPALGQGRYPNRPIRCLIPWPPGGSLDALHRQMFEIAGKDLGQSVVIENIAGARGTRAATYLVQQGRPDGYTIAHHHLSVLRHPFLTRTRTWDPVADFTYIMQITGFVFGTAVRNDAPWKSFAELMEAARRRPGDLTYSTSGIATTNHIAMEDILARERAEMTHVPMRGAQEGVTALLGRQIDVVADAQSWRPQVENGDFRLLSVWTPTRLPSFPEVPTLKDLGYGMSVTSPYGLAGPKGMDAEVVDLLHRTFRKALSDEACQAIMRQWEMPDEYLGPAEYLAFARERVVYERQMVERLKLTID
jgi:tripartite-type tricarboxylate transporter receptor subunit TctC